MPPPSRIVVVHASAGAGHMQAAGALAEAFRLEAPEVDVRVVDALQFSTTVFRRTYVSSYNNIVRRAPGLWGFLYARTSDPRIDRVTSLPRFTIDKLSVRRMRGFLQKARPDAVVSTHFLPLALLSDLRLKQPDLYGWPLTCAITDYTAHPFWVAEGVSRYCVGSAGVVAELSEHGIPRSRAVVTGIPVHPRFAIRGDAREARARLGLGEDGPTVLVMGGGVGMGHLAEVVERILRAGRDYRCIVVCGRNARLRRHLRERYEAHEERQGRIAIRGFVRDIDRLMDAATVVISKAGGLTTSESLAKGLPMLILDPIPGQEERNCNYVVDAGAAIRLGDVSEVGLRAREVLEPGGRLAAMAAAARKAARPDAARTIARLVLEGAARAGSEMAEPSASGVP